MRKLLTFLIALGAAVTFGVCSPAAAQFAGCLGACGSRQFASPPVTTAFDPAHIGSALTLSNSNLTATNSVFASNNARSIASHSTGKYYFEVTMTITNYSADAVGIWRVL
jgi:hypothetical protein